MCIRNKSRHIDGLMSNTAWIVNLYTRAMVDIIYMLTTNVNHKICNMVNIYLCEINNIRSTGLNDICC